MKVENQSEQRLKILKTDGRGEFNSTEFKKLCEEHGIEHEVIASYTPHHNSPSKRRNRTLLDMTMSMLKERNLPKKLWGEVF